MFTLKAGTVDLQDYCASKRLDESVQRRDYEEIYLEDRDNTEILEVLKDYSNF